MTKTENGSEILPTDSRGRVCVSRERREQLLNEFDQSGLSGAQLLRTFLPSYFWPNWRRRDFGRLAVVWS